ncbi:MAG: M20 family metallopeptidase [Bacteroidales bacterium]
MKEQIAKLAKKIFDDVLSIRRHLHKHPELSFEEKRTSEFICRELDNIGVPYRRGIANYGILGIIDTGKKGKTIALRADMDALPIQESNACSYRSVNKGVMHACGHDVHSANLLGTARILNELKSELKGKILLIFQLGEESFPGGAKLMLEDGLFDEYQPDLIIGMHVYPEMDAGNVGFRPGMYMASGDEVHLTVRGNGGHAALPNKLTDTVLASASLITALQQVVSRNAPPSVPSVLSFGKFIANGATNIIPSEVTISGTFRTMDEEWRAVAKERIEEIAKSVSVAHRVSCEVKINHGYPFLVNDEKSTLWAMTKTREILGDDKIHTLDIRMTCEDFAYYSQLFPVVFFRLGTKEPFSSSVRSLHTAEFDIDESALLTGMKTMSCLVCEYLMS